MPLSKVWPLAMAASRLSAPTAFSQALFTHRGEPSADPTQAGSLRASMKAARRAAVGRPASEAAIGERRSQAMAPAERPSTETPPFRPRVSKAQGSPRVKRPLRRRACSGSLRARASVTPWGSGLARPSTAAQAARLSSPAISTARPPSIATTAVSKASEEAWVAVERRSASASRAPWAARRASNARRLASAHSVAQIARLTDPRAAARIRSCGVIQSQSESEPRFTIGERK